MNSRPLLAVLALAAAPLAAQQPGQPMGREGVGHMGDPMGVQEMMGPLMALMVYAPQHLLARQDALGLTADQVARLTRLEDATKMAHDAALADAKAHVRAIAHAAEAAAPDTAALKGHVEAAHTAMGKAQWTALASALQANRVLNDDQRVKVKAWADSMQAWMAQHRRMMNPSESH